MNTVFRCPVCAGRLADWVIRAEFTCHHCRWALASNIGQARLRAVAVGVVVTLGTASAVGWGFADAGQALNVLEAAGFLGVLAGALGFRQMLKLKPLRPQRGAARAHEGVA